MVYVRIKEVLKEKGKTKYWLVKNLECSYQNMTNLMNNQTDSIHFEMLEKLCKLLDCEISDLLVIRDE